VLLIEIPFRGGYCRKHAIAGNRSQSVLNLRRWVVGGRSAGGRRLRSFGPEKDTLRMAREPDLVVRHLGDFSALEVGNLDREIPIADDNRLAF